MPILQHLNDFNRILSDLLALEVNLEEEEDKALLLFSSLSSSYDHLATTAMYGKETLELEDIKQMLQNNELIEKTDSTEETSGLFVNGQRERSKSKGSKRDLEDSSSFSCYFCKKSGHIKKNCIKYKEMLKKKDGKDSDGGSISGSQIKPGLSKKQMRIHVIS